MFLRCPQNCPCTPSGRSFCPPGPPNGPQSGPTCARRAEKVSICGSFFVIFSLFFSLGCQMGSGRVPERPLAPKNDQNISKIDAHAPKSSLSWYPSGPQHSKKENKLSNPNAKNCKEPCIPSEPPKRNKTSRCGGVASAFSNNLREFGLNYCHPGPRRVWK